MSLLLPGDFARGLDLSRVMFRALCRIGGGWTEMLHADAALKVATERSAGAWAGVPAYLPFLSRCRGHLEARGDAV